MSRSLPGLLVKLALFTAFSLLLSAIVFTTLLNTSSKGQRSFAADFVNASGLQPGNTVRIAGVEVGTITAVKLQADHARVTFDLNEDQQPTSTTKAAINYANLLGQRFVNLLPGEGTGEPLRPGSIIPMERTSPGLDLTEVFNGFQPLFAALSPEQVNTLSASIVQVFQGQSGTVESLFKQTAVITEELAGRQELINSVLANLATLLTEVGGHDQQLAQLIDNFDNLLTGLAGSRQQLGTAVTGLADVTTSLGSVLNRSQPALDQDIARLADVTGTLKQEQEGLDDVIQGLPGILTTFAKPLSTGSFLNAYLCNLQVNVTPTIPGSDNKAGPLVISLIPGVPAQGQYPNPVRLPAKTTVGSADRNTQVCRP